MAKLLLSILLLFVAAQGVASTWCPSANLFSSRTCAWGCCYSYGYPCCAAPFYTGAVFIAPVVIGSIFVVIVIITSVIVGIRRRRITTTIRYEEPLTVPQVVTLSSANQYGGFSNSQNAPPPTYTDQSNRY